MIVLFELDSLLMIISVVGGGVVVGVVGRFMGCGVLICCCGG